MTAISKLQFSPFRANFCRGWAKPLICVCSSTKSFLCEIRKPRDKRNNMGYLISRKGYFANQPEQQT